PRRVVFQGVHMMMGGDLGKPWTKADKKESILVFIGKKLPKDLFVAGLEECLAKYPCHEPAAQRSCPGCFRPADVVRAARRSHSRDLARREGRCAGAVLGDAAEKPRLQEEPALRSAFGAGDRARRGCDHCRPGTARALRGVFFPCRRIARGQRFFTRSFL